MHKKNIAQSREEEEEKRERRAEAVSNRGPSAYQPTALPLGQNQVLFSSKLVVCEHGLVTLSLTTNETLKWLSSLPVLMQVILVVTV